MAPGVHAAAHVPPLASHPLTQATGAPHWLLASQVCVLLPVHWVAPGVHTPVQLPLLHAYWQAAGALQFPLASQVCTLLPNGSSLNLS